MNKIKEQLQLLDAEKKKNVFRNTEGSKRGRGGRHQQTGLFFFRRKWGKGQLEMSLQTDSLLLVMKEWILVNK